jgi:hypothetical protein
LLELAYLLRQADFADLSRLPFRDPQSVQFLVRLVWIAFRALLRAIFGVIFRYHGTFVCNAQGVATTVPRPIAEMDERQPAGVACSAFVDRAARVVGR